MNNNHDHQHCARLDCFHCGAYMHSPESPSSLKSCPGHTDNQLVFDKDQFPESELINALKVDPPNFDEATTSISMHISKRLNAYDRRLYNVMVLIYALYKEDGEAVTTTAQIHRLMKFTLSAPSIKQIQKIDHSLTKLSETFVFAAIKYKPLGSEKPTVLDYSRKLLEIWRLSEFIDGIWTVNTIGILANPEPFRFVTERRQITSKADEEEN